MAVFTNSDIKKRRELLKMTAATLAEMIGRDPTTIYLSLIHISEPTRRS